MKDLYAKLSIDQGASAEEVQAALAAKPEISDCSTILLSTEKREIYDSTHSTLKMIGALRHMLGLDSGKSWFLENCPDFVPKRNPSVGVGRPKQEAREPASPEALFQAPARQSEESAPSTPPKWLIPVVVLILAVILIVVVLW